MTAAHTHLHHRHPKVKGCIPARLSAPSPLAVPGFKTTAHHRGILPSPIPFHVKSERTAKLVLGFAEPEISHFSASKPWQQWVTRGLISFWPWYPLGDRWPGGSLAHMPTRWGSGPWHSSRTGSLRIYQRGPDCPEVSQGQFAGWWQSLCGIVWSHSRVKTPLS